MTGKAARIKRTGERSVHALIAVDCDRSWPEIGSNTCWERTRARGQCAKHQAASDLYPPADEPETVEPGDDLLASSVTAFGQRSSRALRAS
jgi:hypothetical protein